jgi:hypothetical protein
MTKYGLPQIQSYGMLVQRDAGSRPAVGSLLPSPLRLGNREKLDAFEGPRVTVSAEPWAELEVISRDEMPTLSNSATPAETYL